MSSTKSANLGIVLGISQRLKKLRLKAGLTQQEVARAIGLKSGSTITKYEEGRVPKPGTLDRLAKFYGVYSSWLITGQGQPPDRGFGPRTSDAIKIYEKGLDRGDRAILREIRELLLGTDDPDTRYRLKEYIELLRRASKSSRRGSSGGD